jgi:hypothetical protein
MPETHAPATTTSEQDRHSLNQRTVNMLWEGTQAIIASAVTVAFIVAQFKGIESNTLNGAFFLIIGFYFGRTNHTNVGGVKIPSYIGR